MRRTKRMVSQAWSQSHARYLAGIPATFATTTLRRLMLREGRHKPLNYYLAGIYREWQHELSHGERPLIRGGEASIGDLLKLWMTK